MALTNLKVQLRQEAKQLRMLFSRDEIIERSFAITKHVSQTFNFSNQCISCFLSIETLGEVETPPLIENLSNKNQMFVPVSNFLDGTMEQVPYQPGDELVLNQFQIPEPRNKCFPIEPEELDVMFIPLLHADLKGNRLGYGRGFYDRYLARCRPDLIKIGLNLLEPIISVPNESTDVRLSYLITPNGIYKFE